MLFSKSYMNLRKRTILLVFIGIVALFLFFPRSILIDYLFYEDEPVKSDVIILLSGDSKRMEKVAELYRAGFADYVLLTNAKAKGSTVEEAVAFGIPEEFILTENEAESTFDNAYFSKEILKDDGFGSAIVVTSNYHMRRSKIAFDRVFYDTPITFTYVPYHHQSITRDSWFEHERLFIREYIKLLGGYILYFDFISNDIRRIFEDQV